MRWLAVTSLLVGFGGCTSLLDLEGTTDVAFDLDADGVSDQRDNCKGVENPAQSDFDGDGVGDLCDPLSCPPDVGASINRDVDQDGIDDGCDACLLGPNDDEDADELPDRCDPCPAVADSQVDTDGDFVGDACDLAATQQRRVWFDGFGPGPHAWIDPGWQVENGALVPKLAPSATTVGSMAVSVPGQAGWFVAVGLELGAQGTFALSFEDSGRTTSCSLSYDDTKAKYRLDAAFSVPPPYLGGQVVSTWVEGSQQVALRMRSDPANSGLLCEIGAINAGVSTRIPSAVPDLTASPGISITYVDLVR